MRYQNADYRGRFAPTPSGPLHLGSLLTALASYFQAKASGGQWLLRIDDLDAPRVVPGAEAGIQQQLEAHGLLWDGPVRRQSEHIDDYQAALDELARQQLLYPCGCSRAILLQTNLRGPDGPVYAGTCRRGIQSSGKQFATRIRMARKSLEFRDGWQGRLQRQLDREIGDFTLRRSDGQIAYQLACAVDEAAQGITEVVRGADLIGSTFRQLTLMELLHIRPPAYRHLPVLVDTHGNKLSKQNHAPALRLESASENIHRCLVWLNQLPPEPLRSASASELIAWGIAHWESEQVPAAISLPI